MKLINKLTLGHLIVSLLVIAVAFAGISTINHINVAFNEVAEQTIPVIKAVEDARTAGLKIAVYTSEFAFISPENRTIRIAIEVEEKELVGLAIKQYDAAILQYEELVNEHFPEERDLLENIKSRGGRLKNLNAEVIALKEQDASGSIVLEKWEEFEEVQQEFLKATDDAITHEDREFAERKQGVEHAIVTSVKNILIAGLLTFIIAIALGVNISNSISKPVIKLKNAAVELGKGELDTRVDIKSSDEVGILAACFNQMADRLEQDITERKQAEKVLREREERYRNLVMNIPDVTWTSDFRGNTIFISHAVEKIYGFTPEEICQGGESLWLGRIHPDDVESVKKAYEELFTASKKFDFEYRIQRKDGEWIWLHDRAITSYEKDGLKYADGIFSDVTERKKLEELRLENKRLAYVNSVKNEFLSRMSHELRTPLNGIIGFAELLKKEELPEKQKRYIDNIYGSGHQLLGIISGILDLVQIESEKEIELHVSRSLATRAIDECLNFIKNKAVQKNVTIKKEIDPRLGFIEADEARFKQVLINLLDNAVKFSKSEGGVVTVAAKIEEDMAKISISDTGIGIKEEDLGKLFQRFEQLDSGTARKYAGTGLGLAISKELVEKHGGKIWAESKYGEGSTFTFLLPLKQKKGEL